jgi:hypothetical protein
MCAARYFGGDNCESGMPIHKDWNHKTNNVEIAALHSPKPLMVITDGDDWTKIFPEVGFPYIQHVYGMYGAEGNAENAHFANEKHDYGPSKRKAAYQFIAKHLGLNLSKAMTSNGGLAESFVTVESSSRMKVFNQTGWPANAVPANTLLPRN